MISRMTWEHDVVTFIVSVSVFYVATVIKNYVTASLVLCFLFPVRLFIVVFCGKSKEGGNVRRRSMPVNKWLEVTLGGLSLTHCWH